MNITGTHIQMQRQTSYLNGQRKHERNMETDTDNKCEILTGIPKPKRGITCAGEDKIKWVRRLLSKDIVVNIVLREEKPQFCKGEGCILIDDMERNIRDWNAEGGTGIVHVTAEETLSILREKGII